MFLADTNVFLEILLRRDKRENCKKFLEENIGNLHITDFSLHSIGVILFRYGKQEVFRKFIKDIILNVQLLSYPLERYTEIVNVRNALGLDFDDAYQYGVAKLLD